MYQIKRIDSLPATSNEDSAPDSISDNKNWLDCNGAKDNPIDSRDDQEDGNQWLRDRETQYGQGLRDPQAAGYEYHTQCSRIELAPVEVQEQGWTGVDNGLYNWNEEERRDQETVGQNEAVYFDQVLYVVWLRISFREIW